MPRPNMRPVSNSSQRILNRASKRAVFDIFQRNNNFRNGQWLDATNSYLEDTITKIEHDVSGNSINSTDLGAYLSISAPLHCVDGWTYLSRSINSLIHGDIHTARHLAYYAELRAAISILAAEGIGILNHQHFIIDRSERCVILPDKRGTHSVVWPVLDYWSQQSSAADLIGSVVKPYGVSLVDWHREFESATTFPAIAAKWLNGWGLDLHQLNNDHHTRNAVSYRPFRISHQLPASPSDVSKFVKSFWSNFLPSGSSKFDELDRFLLNKSLHIAHSALADNANLVSGRNYEERVKSTVSNLFLSKPQEIIDTYINFLSEDKSSPILQFASLQDDLSHPQQVFQMLSRASLLLRLATGASADLILSSGHSWLDFEFWWKALGNDMGLWELGREIDVPDDLWEDVFNSYTEIDEWETHTPNPSIFNLHMTNTNAKELWILSGTERIALWGLYR